MGKFKKWLKLMKPKFKNYRFWILLVPTIVILCLYVATAAIELVFRCLHDASKMINFGRMKTPSIVKSAWDWSDENDKPA